LWSGIKKMEEERVMSVPERSRILEPSVRE
jgi:hypothetical protein